MIREDLGHCSTSSPPLIDNEPRLLSAGHCQCNLLQQLLLSSPGMIDARVHSKNREGH